MTITMTITTLASIGTPVNAADVTGTDNQLLALLNNIANGAQSLEKTRWAQIATPSAPAAGLDTLYFKSDDILYRITSGGIENRVGFTDILRVQVFS